MIYNPISSDLNPFLFLIKEGAFHTYINQVYALNKDKLIKKVIQSFVRPYTYIKVISFDLQREFLLYEVNVKILESQIAILI